MEAPIAALAVAMMIAMAKTSTRSDRDIASLVFMERLNFFRLSVSLGLFRLGLFRFCASAAPCRQSPRIRYFDYAASIFASPQKVPNGSTTGRAFAKPAPNRQINFLFEPMQRFCIPEKASISGHFLSQNTISPIS